MGFLLKKNCPEEEKSKEKEERRHHQGVISLEKTQRELYAPLRDSGHSLNMTYLVRNMGMDTKKEDLASTLKGYG